jgi:hypothetical protein
LPNDPDKNVDATLRRELHHQWARVNAFCWDGQDVKHRKPRIPSAASEPTGAASKNAKENHRSKGHNGEGCAETIDDDDRICAHDNEFSSHQKEAVERKTIKKKKYEPTLFSLGLCCARDEE